MHRRRALLRTFARNRATNLNGPLSNPALELAKTEAVRCASGFAGGDGYDKKSKRPRWPLVAAVGAGLAGAALCAKYFFASNNTEAEVKAEELDASPKSTTTFSDLAGMETMQTALAPLIHHLRNPSAAKALGASGPRGLLLVGRAGTGKSQLAQAVAGEARLPLYRIKGAAFDEDRGGAARVKWLFAEARQRVPCVLLIDEIDSGGAKRLESMTQIMFEMDQRAENEGLFLVATTSKVDDLDKLLLRPGVFDLKLILRPPDRQARAEIFRHYLARIQHDPTIDSDYLAKATGGLTGAHIESMVNHAALLASGAGCARVQLAHLEEAHATMTMGPKQRRVQPTDEALRNTAFHEAGHCVVAHFNRDANALHKVTVAQRGQFVGHTTFLAAKDETDETHAQLLAQLDVLMAGRVSEELVFGPDRLTTGAMEDLKKCTELALEMVREFGMGRAAGLRFVAVEELLMVSEGTRRLVDAEVNRILAESHERVKGLLMERRREHYALAEALLEHETLNGDQVKGLLEKVAGVNKV